MPSGWEVIGRVLSVLVLFAHSVLADDDNSTYIGPFDSDPILSAQPSFSRSLPVQILLTGIVFALVAVLLIHLLFTAQYHYPLAPVNFGLQLSAVISLAISLIASLNVILRVARVYSQQWPYMLPYIAVMIPPDPDVTSDPNDLQEAWNMAELAAWYAMDATTSALVQLTHIQFLTLLYPSDLEARLIFLLLGPLAVLSAAMELLPLHSNPKATDLADVIRNTCNATLSLLFTSALFIWGFLVNRQSSWRMDGGTAAFGAGALLLALVSTALNFLNIPMNHKFVWLPGLMWAVVLWQSFLGWWWWVGSGMGPGDVDEVIRREERRKRRRERRKERAEARGRARMKNGKAWWSRFAKRGDPEGEIELLDVEVDADADADHVSLSPSQATNPSTTSTVASNTTMTTDATTSTTTATSSTKTPTHPTLLTTTIDTLTNFFHTLRLAHFKAARLQAREHRERRRVVFRAESEAVEAQRAVRDVLFGGNPTAELERSGREGEGVEMTRMGANANREGLEFEDEHSNANITAQPRPTTKSKSRTKSKRKHAVNSKHLPPTSSGPSAGPSCSSTSASSSWAPTVLGWGLGSFGIREHERERARRRMRDVVQGRDQTREPQRNRDRSRSLGKGEDDEDEDDGAGTGTGDAGRRDRQRGRDGHVVLNPELELERERERKSVWWWGPLSRWRLRDATVY